MVHEPERQVDDGTMQGSDPGGDGLLRRRLARVGNVLGTGAFVILMLMMAILVITMIQSQRTGGPPDLFGHQLYIITGGSMNPTFEAGSLAILDPVSADEIDVGDVITYRGASAETPLTTHRVREVNESGGERSFVTRGDANRVDDPPVMAEQLVGRVVYTVPYAGRLMEFGQTRRGLLTLVIIPGLVIIGFEVRNLLYLAGEMEKQKRQDQREDESDRVSV